MGEVRASKDALYNSEGNGTDYKLEAKFFMTAPDNESHTAQVPQCQTGM